MSGERERGMGSCTEAASGQRDSPSSVSNVPRAGQIIAGKYEVEHVLGSGGMGVVVAARHLHLGQRVAIKFAHGKAANRSDTAVRFLREARACAALTSEHATRVLDVGTLDTGEPYMVMEYLTGIDLREVLRQRGALPIPEAVGAIVQACDAIGEAHSIGIVHRDLKPANLFRSERRNSSILIKVLDFGISKSTDFNSTTPGESLTASGLVMGSPGYVSPEQIRNAKSVDARTDIWALGVILYELLTGAHPFAGDTPGDTLARIVSNSPLCVREYRPAVPRALAETVATCLERDLHGRVQTIPQLAVRLGPFAPPEAALLVERISRHAGGPESRSKPSVPAPPMTSEERHTERSELGREEAPVRVGRRTSIPPSANERNAIPTKGRLHFAYRPLLDVVVVSAGWSLESEEDVLAWYEEYRRYFTSVFGSRKVDVIFDLSKFDVAAKMAKLFTEYRVRVVTEFANRTYRVNASTRFKTIMYTGTVQTGVPANNFSSIEEAINALVNDRKSGGAR